MFRQWNRQRQMFAWQILSGEIMNHLGGSGGHATLGKVLVSRARRGDFPPFVLAEKFRKVARHLSQ